MQTLSLIPSRSAVIRAHKERGGQVAAVTPIHYPRALLRAFGILPVEVWGPPRVDASHGTAHLQPYVCSIVRNALAFLQSGGLDVADLILAPHTCDSLQGLGSLLIDLLPPRQPVIPVYLPRGRRASDLEFLTREFGALYRRLEACTGRSPSQDDLMASIRREENADRLLARLYQQREQLDLTDLQFYRLVRSREYVPAESFARLALATLALAAPLANPAPAGSALDQASPAGEAADRAAPAQAALSAGGVTDRAAPPAGEAADHAASPSGRVADHAVLPAGEMADHAAPPAGEAADRAAPPADESAGYTAAPDKSGWERGAWPQRATGGGKPHRGIPLVLSGIVPEPMSLFESLAEMGAAVAADDFACCGRRLYPPGTSDDPFQRLAESILGAPPDSTRGHSIQERLEHLIRLARTSGARGIIFYGVKFCEPELFDLPILRKELQASGIPSATVEVDISDPLSHQTLTRLEALVEMLA